jgi:hypothetical protein
MKMKNFILGLGILIVYGLVLWQGVETFYPMPQFDDYCEMGVVPKISRPLEVGENCPAVPIDVQERQQACWSSEEGYWRPEYNEKGCEVGGVCDPCQGEYNDAADIHSRNVFIVSLIVGIITFIVGFSILSLEPVGSALLASGVWAVLWGTVQNWRNFGTGIRFGLLVVVLVLLIWIAYRLNRNGKLFGKKK